MDITFPYNLQAEESVLGAVLLDPASFVRVAESLEFKDFYRPEHQTLYGALMDLFQEGKSLDLVTVRSYLDGRGELSAIGGEAKLARLVSEVASATNIESHAKIIKDKAVLREIVKKGYEIQQMGANPSSDAEAALGHAEKLIEGIKDSQERSGFTEADITHVSETRSAALERLKNPGKISGIATGINNLDKLWLGMAPGDVIIIAGDTAQGKSMLMQRIALNVVERNIPVLYFSLEMPIVEQTARFYAMDKEKFDHVADAVSEMPIYFYSGNSVMDLRLLEKVLAASVRLYKVEACFIDHLHYFSQSAENTVAEIGIISRTLKRLAIKYNVPIVVISTLRKRSRKGMPTMADLKDSVMIAYDADIVTMVWRDITGAEKAPDEVYVQVQKNRVRGNTGSVLMRITPGWDLIENTSKADLKEAQDVFSTRPYADD